MLELLILTLFLTPGERAEPEKPQAGSYFTDVTEQVGLAFTHYNGMWGGYFLPEITGQGGALFDYDNDGDLDVYLVQGSVIGSTKKPSETWSPYKGEAPPRDVLLRNDLKIGPDGKRTIVLTDVTEQSGIRAEGYGMGVAAGDVNNDGFIDLYVTNLGSNQLWINNGKGGFSDRTRESGVDDPGWSTSASFLDYDRDGDLDLFVANYVLFHAPDSPKCYTPRSTLDYCGPDAYTAAPDKLFRNKGDGVFEDATSALKTPGAYGAGLGVVVADLNGDDWLDIYVANDGDANQLWLNGKNGTFTDEALLMGVALNRVGAAEASMGVAAGDFDEDGDEDLFMTHLMDETNTFYVNNGMFFDDRTAEFGLAVSSRRFTAFGTGWFDMDNDGWLDLITLNGAVSDHLGVANEKNRFPFQEPNQLFRNLGGKRFQEIRDPAVFGHRHVSRGAAFGDIDNDGDTDVLILNNNGPARLLLNRSSSHWVGLRLVNDDLKRDMQGAKVRVFTEKSGVRHRRVQTDGSYCSAHDPRIIVGLGSETKITAVEVLWPNGAAERWKNIAADRYTTLKQGTGVSQ